MPRGRDPSWTMKTAIWDLASKLGPKPEAMLRDLEKLCGRDLPLEGEYPPDPRKVKGIIEELQTLSVKVLASLPPYVWEMRKDYKEIQPELERLAGEGIEKPKVLVSLVGRWKEQLQYTTPSQLLYDFGVKNLEVDVLGQVTENEEVFQIYHSAQRVHHKVATSTAGRVIVELEQKEPVFRRLKTQFAQNPVWELYDSWGCRYYSYLEAFSSWFNNLEEVIKAGFMGAIDERLVQLDLTRSLFVLKEKFGGSWDRAVDFELGMRLTCLVVGCDLLGLGFQELDSNWRWFFEISSIHRLRSSLMSCGEKLIKSYSFESGNYSGFARALFNYPEDKAEARRKTTDWLEKLANLQETQDKLQLQLSSWEDTLMSQMS